ncbi:hypothetical protein GpartN1_g6551.t1 [Galdieria partita]|uniref:DNA excision repair protein ERCC-1 n=1 Tax=Galdieria partita TaxID=83374 RepID=A0A9C7Q2M4_9RHOD|nr:hypothetical protein GpartN1_g6551.t1 [Galdieria partita]
MEASEEDHEFTQAFQFLKETEFYESHEGEERERSPLLSPSYSFTSKAKTDLIIAQAKANHFIVVNQATQKNNPLNGFIKQVLWNYGNIIPDYLLGRYTCALFLRISQHLLTPQYIYDRVKAIGKQFRLRILICLIDVEDFEFALKEVTKLCVFSEFTLIVTRSEKEAARYLEAYFALENKPTDVLRERTEQDYISKVESALTSIPSINKTDAMQLITNFKTFHALVNADVKELSKCPGIGPTKVQRLKEALKMPFRNK